MSDRSWKLVHILLHTVIWTPQLALFLFVYSSTECQNQSCGNDRTLNSFQIHVQIFLRFCATIKGGIKFDKEGFRTFRIVINNFRFCSWFDK